MKKISMVSLVALLAATPMMAQAALDPVAKVGLNAQQELTANTDVATTSYVKGAYNALADKISEDRIEINKLEGDSSVTGSVDNKIVAERSAAATLTNKTIDLDSGNTISNIEVQDFKSTAVATSINSDVEQASDSAFATEKAVRSALNTVSGNVGDLGNLTGAAYGQTTVVGAINQKQDRLTAGGSNIATTVVQAANVGEVSASGVNSASDSSLVTQKAALSAALAAETAAKSYTDTEIGKLNSTVSQTTGDITVQVQETAGKLTSVSASINDNAVDSAAIATGAVTSDEILNGTIVVEDIATSAMAAGTGETYSALTDLAQQGYVNQQDAATLSAAKAYTDNQRLTVYTTWNNDSATSEIALNAATSGSED